MKKVFNLVMLLLVGFSLAVVLVACREIAIKSISYKPTNYRTFIIEATPASEIDFNGLTIKVLYEDDKLKEVVYSNSTKSNFIIGSIDTSILGECLIRIGYKNSVSQQYCDITFYITQRDTTGHIVTNFDLPTSLAKYQQKQLEGMYLLADESEISYDLYEVGTDNDYIIFPIIRLRSNPSSTPYVISRFAINITIYVFDNGWVDIEQHSLGSTFLDKEIDYERGHINFADGAIDYRFKIELRPNLEYANEIAGVSFLGNLGSKVLTHEVLVKKGWNAYDLRDLQLINNVEGESHSPASKQYDLAHLWGDYRTLYNTQQTLEQANLTNTSEILGIFLHNDIVIRDTHPNANEPYNVLPSGFTNNLLTGEDAGQYIWDRVAIFHRIQSPTYNPAFIEEANRDFTLSGNYFKIDTVDLRPSKVNQTTGLNTIFSFTSDVSPWANEDFKILQDELILKNFILFGGVGASSEEESEEQIMNYLGSTTGISLGIARESRVSRVSVNSMLSGFQFWNESYLQDTQAFTYFNDVKVNNTYAYSVYLDACRVRIEHSEFTNCGGPTIATIFDDYSDEGVAGVSSYLPTVSLDDYTSTHSTSSLSKNSPYFRVGVIGAAAQTILIPLMEKIDNNFSSFINARILKDSTYISGGQELPTKLFKLDYLYNCDYSDTTSNPTGMAHGKYQVDGQLLIDSDPVSPSNVALFTLANLLRTYSGSDEYIIALGNDGAFVLFDGNGNPASFSGLILMGNYLNGSITFYANMNHTQKQAWVAAITLSR
ncbi:MAG: hypothetical protein LBV55_03700, partial [Acholeplasmatales bacterium]|nr:hypothetical protein [Acholeplasmatales bacterium]